MPEWVQFVAMVAIQVLGGLYLLHRFSLMVEKRFAVLGEQIPVLITAVGTLEKELKEYKIDMLRRDVEELGKDLTEIKERLTCNEEAVSSIVQDYLCSGDMDKFRADMQAHFDKIAAQKAELNNRFHYHGNILHKMAPKVGIDIPPYQPLHPGVAAVS